MQQKVDSFQLPHSPAYQEQHPNAGDDSSNPAPGNNAGDKFGPGTHNEQCHTLSSLPGLMAFKKPVSLATANSRFLGLRHLWGSYDRFGTTNFLTL
jgi:hypothetical protein